MFARDEWIITQAIRRHEGGPGDSGLARCRQQQSWHISWKLSVKNGHRSLIIGNCDRIASSAVPDRSYWRQKKKKTFRGFLTPDGNRGQYDYPWPAPRRTHLKCSRSMQWRCSLGRCSVRVVFVPVALLFHFSRVPVLCALESYVTTLDETDILYGVLDEGIVVFGSDSRHDPRQRSDTSFSRSRDFQ